MAHADYVCCAVCDERIRYSGDEDLEGKTEICTSCLKKLRDMGIHQIDKDEFIAWAQNEREDKVIAVLNALNFKMCYYETYVDEAIKARLGEGAKRYER